MSGGGVVRDRRYRPELDGLRALAFLSVFFFHRMDYVAVDPARHPWLFRFGVIGEFGVPVFFLLSAFLITELLLGERAQTGTVWIGGFYLRRILRIWPLYFAVLAGLAVLNRFVPGVGTNDPRVWLAFSGFGGNWWVVHRGWIAGPFDPLWSLSVEEQFYLLIPVLAALGGRRAVIRASFVLMAAAYLTIALYPLHPGWQAKGEWPNSLVQFQFFGAGSLTAIFLRGRVVDLPVLYRVAGIVLGVECFLVARFRIVVFDRHSTVGVSIAEWLLILAGTALLFLCTLGMAEKLVPGWFSYLGRISYGLYLIHSLMLFLVFRKLGPVTGRAFPALHGPSVWTNLLGTVAALGMSVGFAHFSFRWFERPFLAWKERFVAGYSARKSAERSTVVAESPLSGFHGGAVSASIRRVCRFRSRPVPFVERNLN